MYRSYGLFPPFPPPMGPLGPMGLGPMGPMGPMPPLPMGPMGLPPGPMGPMGPVGPMADAQLLREQHMNEIRRAFPSARQFELGNIWDIPFALKNGRPVTMRVTLPPMYPSVPPMLTLIPILPGKSVDPASGIVKTSIHDSILNWNPRVNVASVLSEVIQRLSQELSPQTPPPPPAPRATSMTAPPRTSPQLPRATTMPPQRQQPLPQPPPQLRQQPPLQPQPPQQPVEEEYEEDPNDPFYSCPEIDSRTEEELDELLRSKDAFNSMFSRLPQVLDAYNEMERVKALENTVQDLTNRAQEAKLAAEELEQRLIKQREELKAKTEKKKALCSPPSYQQLEKMLGEAAAKADEETEDLVKKLMDGSLEPQEFAKQFLEKRSLYHSRAAKREAIQASTPF